MTDLAMLRGARRNPSIDHTSYKLTEGYHGS